MSLKKTGIKSVEGPRRQEGRRAVGLVADDDAAAPPQVEQPEGVGHQHDRHAGRVDGARAAAGTGRRRPRARSTPTRSRPRRRARSSTSTGSPTTACRRSARRSSPATSFLKENPDVVKKFIAASLKGWSFALDNPDKAIKDLKAGLPGSEREAGGGRARRDHAAVLQRRREVHRQGRGRAVGEVAGAAVGGQAAAGGPGSEDLLHERLPAAGVRDARVQVAESLRRDATRWPAARNARATRYADLHVGMAFRSPGRTITDADLVASRASPATTRSCTRATSMRRAASSGGASRTACSGSPTRTGSCGRGPASCARRRSRFSASASGGSSGRSSSATRSS